ncbi:MAG: ribosomal RNA small subunit methyltransferase A [Candidatus Yanofskybacteria bacterium RIFCSPHIGHO2_02_FULL_39_10]|uniref:Ribosomal RNA small subunit methyltransferase A n=1 Tax=Candidatus Yanofskybacteria bacterium RIFCSPHIGHO2_02_FULL_39_10 TaxID=1802674 RepID=A0A1F8F4E3_9BACT|nr:MAG: ribosomal RNA small subunit methyltransferase A [Candidatus Yanofskybacteria bacterium RIFCSPHIGHO2_02_FULL_39_10]
MKLTAKKSLGQNFLINPHIIDKIVTTAKISKNDTVIEIGPGTGNLTKKLVEQAGKVIAIEKDHRLIELLQETLKNYSNVEIIEDDILKFDPEILNTKYLIYNTGFKIVANIPYYITSNFLRIIFESTNPPTGKGGWPKPELIVLMIQKEVAQRILAKPPHMNLLALSVQYYSEPEIIGYISKNNFRPIPKIDSAIIRLQPKSVVRNPQLFNLIRTGFSEKRKQLASLLSKKLDIKKTKIEGILQKIDLDPKVRAENLNLKQWLLLKSYLFNHHQN